MVSNNKFYGWRYRLEAKVSNPVTSSSFLVSVTIPWYVGMRADFRDLRFITNRGVECPYYSESIDNNTEMFVWVKLPAGTSKFWIYYGNGGVKSKSNGSIVFTFFDDMAGSSVDSSKWNTSGAGITVSNSILQLINTTTSCYIESKTTYPVNSLVEMKLSHQSGQKGPFGFRSQSTSRAAAWQGAAGTLLTDHRFSHNGTTGAWHDDGVNRAGAYHIYGVVHIATAPIYFVDYVNRGTNTDVYPGSANLPIHFYCYANQGYIKVDWVRVRTYRATEPTVTLGRKYYNAVNEKTYPWDEAITNVSTSLGISCTVGLKAYLADLSTTVGFKSSVLFRHPHFYIPPIIGPYPRWKFTGVIRYPSQVSGIARLRLKKLQGMKSDGRDLRFATKQGKKLRYNIYNTTSTYFDIWVELPSSTTMIHYFYGNGVARSESNSSIIGTPVYETITHVDECTIPNSKKSMKYHQWKGEGIISLSAASSTGQEQILVTIPKKPGMSSDGRDLRFTYPDGNTKLSYFIESVSSTSFSVWVKLPKSKRKIKFFYGNPLAESESSGEDTFYFYDDFTGTALNTSKWTLVSGTATVANSCLTLANTSAESRVYSPSATFGTGYRLEIYARHDSNNEMKIGHGNSAASLLAVWLGAYGSYNYDYAMTYDGSTTTRNTNSINRSGSTFYKYALYRYTTSIRFMVNDVVKLTNTASIPSGNLNIFLSSEANAGNVVIDWVRVWRPVSITGTVKFTRRRPQDIFYYTDTWYETVEVIPDTKVYHKPQAEELRVSYDFIRPDIPPTVGLSVSDPVLVERRVLRDYTTGSISVEQDIENAYSQLKTQFYADPVPTEDSSIKHVVNDSYGVDRLLFAGKILPSTATMGRINQVTSITAVDSGVNLATQVIPWAYQVVDTETVSIPTWVERIVDYENTGVYLNTAIDTQKDPYQFVFDAKTKRLEALKTLAEYAGCMYTTKLKQYTSGHFTIIRPEFYFVPPEQIDDVTNGFDLPDPVILENPASTMLSGSTLLDEPEIETNSEDRYNKVTVYGTLSDTGETVVSSAFSYEVYTGAKKAREYIIEDNTITEKGSTAEKEAVKWLLYFLAPRVTVTMQFANRFDFELYQRIKFGDGFPQKLTELTNSEQVDQVAVTDPTSGDQLINLIDVSGVPRPSWLRISALTYTSKDPIELVKVKAVTDYIYSNSDPVIQAPYSAYLSPGYYKPTTDDSYSNTSSIVEDTIEKQLTPESCTVLSINTENKTAVVQTASGKIVTVSLA